MQYPYQLRDIGWLAVELRSIYDNTQLTGITLFIDTA